jgi:hypothetical protein
MTGITNIFYILEKYPIKNKKWSRPVGGPDVFIIERSEYPKEIKNKLHLWTDPWNRLFPDIRKGITEYHVNSNFIPTSIRYWDIETTVEGRRIMCRINNDDL